LYTIVRGRNINGIISVEQGNIIPFIENSDINTINKMNKAKMIMLPDNDEVISLQKSIKEKNPHQIVAIRMKASPGVAKDVIGLVKNSAEVIHIVFDAHGREASSATPRHARDVLRDVHTTLVKEGVRDQVTITASGGVAMAEHMAKAIICGADLVAIDLPLLVAMECRLCRECERGEHCQIDLEKIESDYAVSRITNLICAWRNQLLELLGAMGIREVRRLRGETGRSMFFEDLEKETFGRLFGKRKQYMEVDNS